MPEEYVLDERFHLDRLVVALSEQEVVTRTLAALGVTAEVLDSSTELGLALMKLTNVAAVASGLPDYDSGQPYTGESDHAHLNHLVKNLPAHITRKYPGWKVKLGKDYQPDPVKGYPHLGGGNGDPRPTDTPLGYRAYSECRPCGTAGSGVRVGLLDTGIYPGTWLNGRYLAGDVDVDIIENKASYTMFDGHCAFVASCILQEAPAAEVHVRKVLDGQGDSSAWEAAVAMAEIAQTGMDVVNLSFGEYRTADHAAPMLFETAIRKFSSETVIVAAAGNNGNVKNLASDQVADGIKPNSASYPAAAYNVVGVGALDKSGNRAAFTPDDAPWIALLAPGVGLTGAYVRGDVDITLNDKYGNPVDPPKTVYFDGKATWEGCSFAAGVVSGAIAAGTVPGRRSAREALEELLHRDPRGPGCGIRPYIPLSLSNA